MALIKIVYRCKERKLQQQLKLHWSLEYPRLAFNLQLDSKLACAHNGHSEEHGQLISRPRSITIHTMANS